MLKKFVRLSPLIAGAALSVGAASRDDAEWKLLRQSALERRREIIVNNDGGDALAFPRKWEVTAENFFRIRMNAAAGRADTLFYVPTSSGFGNFTCRTTAGETLLADPPNLPERVNITAELLRRGTDPVALALEFCRRNRMEFFLEIRVNDTHDADDSGSFLTPKFKILHPDMLFGSRDRRPPYCNWSAVNFARPEVRSRLTAIVAEFCSQYDLDGISLDFMRHVQLFRSVGDGDAASPEELEAMNGMMRDIRAAVDRAGRERGRPLLLSVRVPDSPEFCRAVGIDIKHWLEAGLIDMMVGGSYFTLRPWRESSELAHRYGVKFYASLDEARTGALPIGERNSREAYVARAAAAFEDGVDGVHYFNMHRKYNFFGRSAVRFPNKLCYLDPLGGGGYTPEQYLCRGDDFLTKTSIAPNGAPAQLRPGEPLRLRLVIGDGFENSPEVSIVVRADVPDEAALTCVVNGFNTPPPRREADVFTFTPPAGAMRRGLNEFVLAATGRSKVRRRTILSGKELLVWNRNQLPWRRFTAIDGEEIVGGSLRITDRSGDGAPNLLYPVSGARRVLRGSFEVMVEESDVPESVVFRVANGEHVEVVALERGRTSCVYSGIRRDCDNSADFVRYDFELGRGRFRLRRNGADFIDSEKPAAADDPRVRLKEMLQPAGAFHRRGILLGSLSRAGRASARWKNVELEEDFIPVSDFAVSIKRSAPKNNGGEK